MKKKKKKESPKEAKEAKNARRQKSRRKLPEERDRHNYLKLETGGPLDQSLDNRAVKSGVLDTVDPIYIVPLDGRDESMPNEGLPNSDTWQHLGLSSVRRFDAPAPDQATSPPSV